MFVFEARIFFKRCFLEMYVSLEGDTLSRYNPKAISSIFMKFGSLIEKRIADKTVLGNLIIPKNFSQRSISVQPLCTFFLRF